MGQDVQGAQRARLPRLHRLVHLHPRECAAMNALAVSKVCMRLSRPADTEGPVLQGKVGVHVNVHADKLRLLSVPQFALAFCSFVRVWCECDSSCL